MKSGISRGVPSLDLWKCFNHRKLSSEIISRDSEGSPECWCTWPAPVALFHTPWTHQPLLTAQFNTLKLLLYRDALRKIPQKQWLCQTEETLLGKFPKIWFGKKETILEELPIRIAGALEVQTEDPLLTPFLAHLAQPWQHQHHLQKAKGKNRVKTNTFHDNIPISYSSCNAGDIIPLTYLQSFYSQSV